MVVAGAVPGGVNVGEGTTVLVGETVTVGVRELVEVS